MTILKLHYLKLSEDQKKEFKDKVIARVGISESSFYRFLEKMPNQLYQEVISDLSQIEKPNLYKTI